MVKRISILCLALLLALLYSFTGSRKERVDFSRVERRMLHIPTAGLFDGTGYFTVTSADMERDGWSFPVEDGVLFTPDFRHEPVGWYIMSPEVKHEVRAAMQGVVRLVRKTDLGKTVVVLHPNGMETVYAHHAKTLVESGDYVSAGQAIALAGANHGVVYTYFALMVNGVPMSPSTLARPDGSLKFDAMQFRLDESGYVRASFCRRGEIVERPPRFDWFRVPELVDLDRPFSAMERQHVGVATPGLFDGASSFTIDLSRIGKWSYPLPGAKVISPYGGARKNGPENEAARQDTGGVRRGSPLLRKVFRIREHGGSTPCQRAGDLLQSQCQELGPRGRPCEGWRRDSHRGSYRTGHDRALSF